MGVPDNHIGGSVTEFDCAYGWDFNNMTAHYGYKTKSVFNQYCLPNNDGPKPEGLDFELNAIYGDVYITDLQEAWLDIKSARIAYIQVPFTVFIVAGLYITLLHFRTKLFMWISVFVSFAFIFSIAIYLQDYHDKYFCEECKNPTTAGNALRAFYIVLYVLASLYVLLVICLFKD